MRDRIDDIRARGAELVLVGNGAPHFAAAFREDFELDPTIELVIDPEDRGHPADDVKRSELVRKLVHFQLSNLLASEDDLGKARERLIHRYELMTKRSSEITEEDVLSSFLDAFARSLDPHSNYFSADAMEDFQIGMSLSLEGIGVALSERDGYSVVEQIIPGGAAEKVGVLEPEDKIIAVAEPGEPPVDIIDMALRDVVRLIRGRKGTDVVLTVLRERETFQVTITREIRRSDKSTYTVFPVRLTGDDAGEVKLCEPRTYSASRGLAEELARFLELPLADSSSGTEVVRGHDQLDESLQEHLRESGALPELPEPVAVAN